MRRRALARARRARRSHRRRRSPRTRSSASRLGGGRGGRGELGLPDSDDSPASSCSRPKRTMVARLNELAPMLRGVRRAFPRPRRRRPAVCRQSLSAAAIHRLRARRLPRPASPREVHHSEQEGQIHRRSRHRHHEGHRDRRGGDRGGARRYHRHRLGRVERTAQGRGRSTSSRPSTRSSGSSRRPS